MSAAGVSGTSQPPDLERPEASCRSFLGWETSTPTRADHILWLITEAKRAAVLDRALTLAKQTGGKCGALYDRRNSFGTKAPPCQQPPGHGVVRLAGSACTNEGNTITTPSPWLADPEALAVWNNTGSGT